MEILKGVKIIDLALWLEKEEILILGDLHLGYEEAVNKQGVLLPRFQFRETMNKLKEILQVVKPKTIIINGDLKHEFGRISRQEWRNVSKLVDHLLKHSEVILIKGNHDPILKPIAEKKSLEIKKYFYTNKKYICHGDYLPGGKDFKDSETIIIGHEHPAITITDGVSSEKYKCFLKGKYENKKLIVMPSFNPVTQGTDILKEKIMSPLIKNVKSFEVYVIEDKIYNFGKAGRLLNS